MWHAHIRAEYIRVIELAAYTCGQIDYVLFVDWALRVCDRR